MQRKTSAPGTEQFFAAPINAENDQPIFWFGVLADDCAPSSLDKGRNRWRLSWAISPSMAESTSASRPETGAVRGAAFAEP